MKSTKLEHRSTHKIRLPELSGGEIALILEMLDRPKLKLPKVHGNELCEALMDSR